ncbi:uncharacterized protein ARB_06069 [Trichophyton benhamiae CBS 112371]|uniref:Uncharacterized protein n=1 Tax=Arthroderma benhamiae (strain ATCC MYA-4681 / CBS 112371) TaxID=663331 RepID=D4APA2_ARTBC|nr:uncharacterized protein ARB_06069 [Trichophyton benhamiae CBS 112371]EFE35113.1 hypothetical protein ARB_06069 [Trichophyton benhamiae CBS 112371]
MCGIQLVESYIMLPTNINPPCITTVGRGTGEKYLFPSLLRLVSSCLVSSHRLEPLLDSFSTVSSSAAAAAALPVINSSSAQLAAAPPLIPGYLCLPKKRHKNNTQPASQPASPKSLVSAGVVSPLARPQGPLLKNWPPPSPPRSPFHHLISVVFFSFLLLFFFFFFSSSSLLPLSVARAALTSSTDTGGRPKQHQQPVDPR